VYRLATLRDQIRAEAANYLQRHIEINAERRRVLLPELLQWFESDFCDDEADGLVYLARRLPQTDLARFIEDQLRKAEGKVRPRACLWRGAQEPNALIAAGGPSRGRVIWEGRCGSDSRATAARASTSPPSSSSTTGAFACASATACTKGRRGHRPLRLSQMRACPQSPRTCPPLRLQQHWTGRKRAARARGRVPPRRPK